MGNLLSTGLVGTFACPEAFAKPPQPHLLLFADDHVAGGAERDRWQHRQCDRKLHLPLRVPLWHHVSSACIPWRGKRDTWHLGRTSQGRWHHLRSRGHSGTLCSDSARPRRCEQGANHLSHSLCRGSAWANTVAQYSQTIFLFLYIIGKKLHVKTWGGKSI